MAVGWSTPGGGDSLLIVFDGVGGAVRCAMKVQQEMPTYDGDQPADQAIRFRVGINVGEVIPDGTDIHGDVVNVARLQADCPRVRFPICASLCGSGLTLHLTSLVRSS
jgi:class 3 adenylate cyclase